MLKRAFICAIALVTTFASTAAIASPPLYPSFTTDLAKPGRGVPLYPSFNSPKVSSSPTSTVFSVTGATNTSPAAINDSGVVVGSYWFDCSPSNVCEKSFIRAADGTITTFGVPGADETQAVAINASGETTGFFSGNGTTGSFVRKANGKIIQFGVVNSSDDVNYPQASGINDRGEVVGNYSSTVGNPGNERAFIRGPGGFIKGIDVADGGTPSINASGMITGYYGGFDDGAFVRTPDGAITRFHIGNLRTFPSGINAAGTVAGFYNTTESTRGFVRASDGTLTRFNVDGDAQDTEPGGINDSGVVVGTFVNKAGKNVGFARAADGTITKYSLPTPKYAGIVGVNNGGVMIGFCQSSVGGQQIINGFVLVP
jgi:hypothetical protein